MPVQVKPTISPAPAPVMSPAPAPVAAAGAQGSIGNPTNPWESPGDPSGDEAWYEKWWVWTIVGVAVVGGATAAGVVLGTGGESTPAGFRADVKW